MHCMNADSEGGIRAANPTWWTKTKPVQIDTTWNDLNDYRHGKTCLLHYTKEPDQPWYKPDHPHAKHWKYELKLCLADGTVTSDEIRAAVGNFGKKEDWRPTNGLHPEYLKMLG